MTRYTTTLAPIFPVNTIRTELDRLFDEAFTTRPSGAWTPRVDAREDAAGFSFHFDVPGIEPDAVEVLAEDGALIVRGERAPEEVPDGERQLISERATGRFERRFRLPKSADVSVVSASYVNGVLSVRIAKVAPAQPRRVPVTVPGAAPAGSEKSE